MPLTLFEPICPSLWLPWKFPVDSLLIGPMEGLGLSSSASDTITWYRLVLLIICTVGIFVLFIHLTLPCHAQCLKVQYYSNQGHHHDYGKNKTLPKLILFHDSCQHERSSSILKYPDLQLWEESWENQSISQSIKMRVIKTKWEVEVNPSLACKEPLYPPSETEQGPRFSKLRHYTCLWGAFSLEW